MRQSKLFQANLIGQIILFSVIAVILSVFFSLTLQTRLTEEFINRGTAISQSIANSSVELLLNRDASTIQATIDQFLNIENGVAYVFVVDDQGEFFAHTFVPGIPPEILDITEGSKDRTVIRDLSLADGGEFIDIAAPILAGSVGFVHIGMDKGIIWATVWSAIIQQVGLIAVIFVVAVAITYIQANRISQPVMQLANFARRMTSSSIAELAVLQSDPQLLAIAKREDEVGQLTANFQQMVAEIQGREQRLEQRATHLETISSLGERLTAILDFDQLLVEMVNQVKDSFDYYHAHVYIIDDEHQTLVMTAGAGEAGTKMKTKGHNIPLNAPTSLVARAARSNQIVSVDNVREAPDWLPNPLLPDTYSELAIPIVLEGEVVGVLDVQEDEVAGLDEGDAGILRLLANQVAVAIRNARHFEAVQQALAEARVLQEQYLEQAWNRDRLSRYATGRVDLRLDGPESSPAHDPDGQAEIRPGLAAPLRLQDKIIGHLKLEDGNPDRAWTEQELALVNAVLDQVAQTADNLRLLEDVKERASRDRLVNDVSAKLRGAPDMESLLEIGAAELAKILNPARTFVRLGPETALEGDAAEENLNGVSDGN